MSDKLDSMAKSGARKSQPWWLLAILVGGIPVFGGLSYYLGRYKSAEKRVSGFCANFTPGLSVAAVAKIAAAQGMNAPTDASTTYVMETATSGHYGCKLEFKDNLLESSTYEYRN